MSIAVIKADQKALSQSLKLLAGMPDKARTALARALNKSAFTARSALVKQVRSRFQIQARRVRDTVRVVRATPQSEEPVARVVSAERRQPASRFRLTPGSPVSWRALPNSARRPRFRLSVAKGRSALMKHAFLARFSSGHLGLVERSGRRTDSGKRQLREFYGPAVPQMTGGQTGAEAVAEKAAQTLQRELDRQVGVLLKS